jgi:hypothetical protein
VGKESLKKKGNRKRFQLSFLERRHNDRVFKNRPSKERRKNSRKIVPLSVALTLSISLGLVKKGKKDGKLLNLYISQLRKAVLNANKLFLIAFAKSFFPKCVRIYVYSRRELFKCSEWEEFPLLSP